MCTQKKCPTCHQELPKLPPAYRLDHNVPGLERGAVFILNGIYLQLAWKKGMCQTYCAGVVQFHSDALRKGHWFTEILNSGEYTV